MNWEQKLEALNALDECSLKMREPGDWYIRQNTQLKEGKMLRSAYGNGATPEAAVESHWKELVEASSYSTPIVLSPYGQDRREVYWNGYRWVDKKIERPNSTQASPA